MKISEQTKYITPQIKIEEVRVEKGFLVSGIIMNDRNGKIEKHYLDEVEEW